MRAKLLALVIVGIASIFVLPLTTTGQPGGKGKGGFNMVWDAGASFDKVANGRASVPISEIVRFGKDQATQFAQERGITNGQFTRSQYVEFSEQLKAKMSGGFGGDKGGKKAIDFGGNADGGFGGKKKGFGGPDGGGFPGGQPAAPPSIDMINQLADADFKRRDANDDGKLNVDEMPGPLRMNLAKWDKNSDGLIDRNEYREYFAARLGGGGDDSGGAKGIASILIDEDELDRKTVVFRDGGKVPAGLPPWFRELQVDGQVPYYAWRAAKKTHEEFKTWDLNDDALITMEEAMKVVVAAKGGPRSPGDISVSVGNSGSMSGDRPSFGGFGGFKKGGKDGGNGGDNGADRGKKKKGGFGGG